MVVNLCQAHFQTTVHCNKLCADGYEVTNLLSVDPAVRRRGFKLEYFLRPPVQVTLKFAIQVELCRVDVELWPWGMDRGQACKKLEISTSSDPLPALAPGPGPCQDSKQGQREDQIKTVGPGQHGKAQTQERHPQHSNSRSNGQQWSFQAKQWRDHGLEEPQQRGRGDRQHRAPPQPQSNIETSYAEPEFKLMGRCELREKTLVCFSHPHFRPRKPFLSPPPPQPADCHQEQLWSRGVWSLGSVTQLRVTLPYGGAGSALGVKALAVWGLPAKCCSAAEVERFKSAHESSQRLLPSPRLWAPSMNQPAHLPPAATPPSCPSVPEEFLDPITQEVMSLPMLLPCGMSVDNTTLEEQQKREATWGRPPSDPFTGVPFSAGSQPLPNPQLKSRIDRFVLQTGLGLREGALGRHGEGEKPLASRLLEHKVEGENKGTSPSSNKGIVSRAINHDVSNRHLEMERNGSGNGNAMANPQPGRSEADPLTKHIADSVRPNKREQSGKTKEAPPPPTDTLIRSNPNNQVLPECKRTKTDKVSAPSSSSHEQRLSSSLDEALVLAMRGRPSFTSHHSQSSGVTIDTGTEPEPSRTSQSSATESPTGEKCSKCSCSLSHYATSTSVYRLRCCHFLCRPCLHRMSRSLNTITLESHILCPTCHTPAPCSDIIRVHH